MKKDKSLARRIYILIAVMGIWGAAIGTRLYFLHVVHSADYRQRAERQQQRMLDVSPRRGIIYDRNGNELAASVKGDSGRIVMMTDARGRRFQTVQQAPAPGANLITTIDENIQYIIEKELQAGMARTRAKGMSIVAMDPRSGEILGMANYPTFNPNEYTPY